MLGNYISPITGKFLLTVSWTISHNLLTAEQPRVGVVSDPVRHGRDEGQDVWQLGTF